MTLTSEFLPELVNHAQLCLKYEIKTKKLNMQDKYLGLAPYSLKLE